MILFWTFEIKLVFASAFVTTNEPASITTNGLQNPANVPDASKTPVTPKMIQHDIVISPKGHLFITKATIIKIITPITI